MEVRDLVICYMPVHTYFEFASSLKYQTSLNYDIEKLIPQISLKRLRLSSGRLNHYIVKILHLFQLHITRGDGFA